MKVVFEHPWDLSPSEAIALQKELSSRVITWGKPAAPELILALDVSYLRQEKMGYGAAVLFDVESSENEVKFREIKAYFTVQEVEFPYIPGLLSFREIPVLLNLCRQIGATPDLVLVDGMGVAHPRRIGLASHIGILLDIPTIGIGKSRLTGEYSEPGNEKGESSVLMDHGEKIGYVLRSRTGVKPIFVSPGHKIGFEEALNIVLSFCTGTRIPFPIKIADAYTRKLRHGEICAQS